MEENLAPITSKTLPSSIRCIASTTEEEGFIVGTTNNEIYACLPNGVDNELVVGHTEEIWALVLTNNLVISGSDEGRLVVRDCLTGLHKWNVKVTEGIKAVCVQPQTDNILVGTDKGKIVTFSCESDELNTLEACGDEIVCMSFSFNGQFLAVGSKDQAVYLFEYKNLEFCIWKG